MNYWIEVNIVLVVYLLVYRVFFSRLTFFNLNRWVLLAAVPLAFGIPLLPEHYSITPLTSVQLSTLELSTTNSAQGFTSTQILAYFYWAISGFLLLRLAFQMSRIFRLKKSAEQYFINGRKVFNLKQASSFTFFRWIFLSGEGLNSTEKQQVFLHEQVHSKELHSVDVLLAELNICINWWNPLSWYLPRWIKLNHEYIADERCIARLEKRQYGQLLIATQFGVSPQLLATPFNHQSHTQKRIKMLYKKHSSKSKMWRYALIIPLVFTSAWLVTGQELTTQEVEIEVTVENEMPEFPGGMEGLMKYMVKNLKYPKNAEKAGIEGTTVVSFVVTENGDVTEVKVLKGFNAECDDAAVRVISGMPNWKPGTKEGKKAAMKMSLPVKFKL